MKYLVIELQASDDAVNHLVNTYNSLPEAEAGWHQVLMYAATSEIPYHSAMLITQYGELIKKEMYDHTLKEPTDPE